MCTHKNDRPLQKHIAIVGVGSGGSALADMLWKKDADKIYGEFILTLVDPDRFENSNVTRHDLPPIFSPGIMRLSPVLGSPTLHLQSHSDHRKKRLRPAEPCERSRTKPRSSAQTPLV